MYLTKATRVALLIFLSIGLLLLFLGLASPTKDARIGLLITGGIFLTFGSRFFYFFSEGRKRDFQKDVLRYTLQLDPLIENNGIQYALIPFPDELRVPSSPLLVAFMQNAHSTPRIVIFKLKTKGVATQQDYSITVSGYEAGIFCIPIILRDNIRAKEINVRFKVKVHKERGTSVGARTIEKEGARRLVGVDSSVIYNILEGKNNYTPTEEISPPFGYFILYKKGMLEPDLNSLQKIKQYAELPIHKGENL